MFLRCAQVVVAQQIAGRHLLPALVGGIARDLGVGANLLGSWCREANVDGQAGGGEKVSAQEYERMRRELGKVKTERDILKKALRYFAADLK